MSKTVMVVAPHPDDETLGCAGALLRHAQAGDTIIWLVITSMHEVDGYTLKQIDNRQAEMHAVAQRYGFAEVVCLGLRTARLDSLPLADLISHISSVFQRIRPEILYIPYRYDAHSDHGCVFDAVSACSKSFRYPFIRSVYAYETLSETGFGLTVENSAFSPNLFVDISHCLEQKLSIMMIYQDEIGTFPFPRSQEAVKALAQLRGAQANMLAAEAFMILKELR
jgi:LmbE family N-acetylglucosaminyl deacetylase